MTEENEQQFNTDETLEFEFPKSERIAIHKSDLQIQLERFKERIFSSFSIYDLLAIVSLWSPIFSSDFRAVIGLTSNEMKVGYFVFASIITIFILWSRISFHIFNYFREDRVSPNPEKMVDKILEQCNQRNNK